MEASMEANNNTQKSDDCNDESYEPQPNDVLKSLCDDKNYIVEEILGRGAYGIVVKCLSSTGDKVAVKIAGPDERNSAMTEFDLLKTIRQFEGANEYLIEMLGVFMHNRHVCISLELMEMSLYHYMYKTATSENDLCPDLCLSEIRRILHDILMGLIKLKEMDIIHADLKPANVMLKNCGQVRQMRAKIIDFGLAHFASRQSDEPVIQTLYYRSPEVMLGCLPYSEAIDVWSLGCIMGELMIKLVMYCGRCEYDQLRFIAEKQGLPPLKMIEQGRRSHLHFAKATDGTFLRKMKTPTEFLATVSCDDFDDITEDMVAYERCPTFECMLTAVAEGIPMDLYGDDRQAEVRDRLEAFKLFAALLKLDPQERISANEAVQHAFFQMKHLEPFADSSERARACFEVMNVPIDVKEKRNEIRDPLALLDESNRYTYLWETEL